MPGQTQLLACDIRGSSLEELVVGGSLLVGSGGRGMDCIPNFLILVDGGGIVREILLHFREKLGSEGRHPTVSSWSRVRCYMLVGGVCWAQGAD